jgi:hypothetical protein
VPPDVDARGVLEAAYRNLYGHDFVQVLSISARFPGGRHFTRRLQITRKQTGGPGRALVRFLDPPDIRRTAMLLLQRPERYDDIYLFLPAFEMVRHVAVAQRADSFFGTDIAFEDLEPKDVEQLDVRPATATEAIGGHSCHPIETRPRAGFESTYERLVTCIDVERPLVLWTDFYRGGQRVKHLEVDRASVRRIGERWIPFRAVMTTPTRGTETILETESYEPRDDLPDALFTIVNLSAGDPARDRSRTAPKD